jgi:hypothetical protein
LTLNGNEEGQLEDQEQVYVEDILVPEQLPPLNVFCVVDGWWWCFYC